MTFLGVARQESDWNNYFLLELEIFQNKFNDGKEMMLSKECNLFSVLSVSLVSTSL